MEAAHRRLPCDVFFLFLETLLNKHFTPCTETMCFREVEKYKIFSSALPLSGSFVLILEIRYFGRPNGSCKYTGLITLACRVVERPAANCACARSYWGSRSICCAEHGPSTRARPCVVLWRRRPAHFLAKDGDRIKLIRPIRSPSAYPCLIHFPWRNGMANQLFIISWLAH